MRKNLGKIIILMVLFLGTQLSAKHPADFSLAASKTTAYVKEAVEITFTATQTDHTDVMYFFVEPEKSSDYAIELLRKESIDHSYHSNTTTFRFILFPLKPGKVDVRFDFTVKTASDKGVAQAYAQDHYDSEGIQLVATDITVAPLAMNIIALKEPVDLVGDFTLDQTVEKTEINAYDALNLRYRLEGTGYRIEMADLVKPIDGVTIFSDHDEKQAKLTPEGYRQQQIFYYALSARKNFTVPPLELKAFSPREARYYSLKAPAVDVKVRPLDTAALLDKTESPTPTGTGFADLRMWLIYVLIFIVGYFSAKVLPAKITLKRKPKRFGDIRAEKDPKGLVILLTNRYRSKKTEIYIEQLEALVYAKEAERSFETIKAALLKTLEQESQ